jgi:hypothetical protein
MTASACSLDIVPLCIPASIARKPMSSAARTIRAAARASRSEVVRREERQNGGRRFARAAGVRTFSQRIRPRR